jgi:type II secretory pathway pseudopilin PulG
MKMTRQKRGGGFSLVEVTLALGLVSFCLLTLVGLLPVGLGSLKTSNDEAAATNCLEQIAGSIQVAVLQTNGTYSGKYQASGAFGSYNTLAWSLGGSQFATTLNNLSASGFPGSGVNEQRFVAEVVITPPVDAFSTGTALISVAWPIQATWDATKNDWKNAQGSVRTLLIFLPNS